MHYWKKGTGLVQKKGEEEDERKGSGSGHGD